MTHECDGIQIPDPLRRMQIGSMTDAMTLCAKLRNCRISIGNAMVTMARQKRRTNGIIEPSCSIWVVAVVVAAFLVLVGFFVTSAKLFTAARNRFDGGHASDRHYSSPDDIPLEILNKLDAILVLGGGAPASLTEPPVYVQRRADDAAKVIRRLEELKLKNKRETSSLPILCLSAGTAHLPQLLGPDGFPIWESTSCAAYLAEKHRLTRNVFVETSSYDTIGNAFFARTSHTDVNGWRHLLVITTEFHMNRTAAIFNWIFVDCSSVDRNKRKRVPYELYFLSSPNVGLTEEAIAARKEREEQSRKNVQDNLARKYTTLPDVWKFLNSDHALYSADKLIQRGQGSLIDPTANDLVKKSYGLKDG